MLQMIMHAVSHATISFCDEATLVPVCSLTKGADGGLCRCEPRNRHAIRRTRNIVQPQRVAERNARWFAAVLPANPDLQAVASSTPALHRLLHQRSDATP